MKVPSLRFALSASGCVASRVVIVRPDLLRERAALAGIVAFELDWAGLFRVELFVEDDLEFLADSYLELESGNWRLSGVHDVMLGDGLLDVRSRVVEGRVVMRVKHVPYLDKRFLESQELVVDFGKYLGAWRSLAMQLQAFGAVAT